MDEIAERVSEALRPWRAACEGRAFTKDDERRGVDIVRRVTAQYVSEWVDREASQLDSRVARRRVLARKPALIRAALVMLQPTIDAAIARGREAEKQNREMEDDFASFVSQDGASNGGA